MCVFSLILSIIICIKILSILITSNIKDIYYECFYAKIRIICIYTILMLNHKNITKFVKNSYQQTKLLLKLVLTYPGERLNLPLLNIQFLPFFYRFLMFLFFIIVPMTNIFTLFFFSFSYFSLIKRAFQKPYFYLLLPVTIIVVTYCRRGRDSGYGGKIAIVLCTNGMTYYLPFWSLTVYDRKRKESRATPSYPFTRLRDTE